MMTNKYNENFKHDSVLHENNNFKKKHDSNKTYVPRNSLLTDLMNVSHIKSLHRICTSILIVFSYYSILARFIQSEDIFEGFYLIQSGFGKFNLVLYLWLSMQIVALLFHFIFSKWVHLKKIFELNKNLNAYIKLSISLYVIFQIIFLTIVCTITIWFDLPPASSLIITAEMTRLMMKFHAFVRTTFPGILHENKNSTQFINYLYFIFAPVLVFKDSYPRTNYINWNNVLKNFAEVLACILCLNFIFDSCFVQQWKYFGSKSELFEIKNVAKLFCNCSYPSIVLFVICFYMILHSWLNGCAELLKFADREFYSDWWNQKGYKSYYKTWNIVVQDWLYLYVYRDIHNNITKNRIICQLSVFIVSAIFHELCMSVSLGFVYPVLFFSFMGPGYTLIHAEKYMNKNIGNIFLWITLILGIGIQWTLYTIEYYARINCPPVVDNYVLELFIPRSWFCY